jgi:hypothetical protein
LTSFLLSFFHLPSSSFLPFLICPSFLHLPYFLS